MVGAAPDAQGEESARASGVSPLSVARDSELVLAGGLAKTPETGQILADVFRTPVTLLESAEEGTAWGSALLAVYRHMVLQGQNSDWASWLTSLASDTKTRFVPDSAAADLCDTVYARYLRLLKAQPQLNVGSSD